MEQNGVEPVHHKRALLPSMATVMFGFGVEPAIMAGRGITAGMAARQE